MPFGKLQAGCHVTFTEEWFLSDHSTIKVWLVECCRDGCPSGRFSQSPKRNSGALLEWPSGSCSFPWPRPFSADCPVCLRGSKLLPFKNDGGHCVLGDLQCCRNSFDLMAWFLLWHALSAVGPYIDRCVPFQIMSNQLNLPQVDSNHSCKNTSRVINGKRMHLSSISSLTAKSLKTYVNKVFLFFIFNTFANISKIAVFALSLWNIVCRLTRIYKKYIYNPFKKTAVA